MNLVTCSATLFRTPSKPAFWGGNGQRGVYVPDFGTKGGIRKMLTFAPPVLTLNHSNSVVHAETALPRPVPSTGIDLHEFLATSSGQTLPRKTRAPPKTPFSRTTGWVYPPSPSSIYYPLLPTFLSLRVRNIVRHRSESMLTITPLILGLRALVRYVTHK